MGVLIEQDGTNVTVHGNGLHGLKAPSETLDVGNSGTTTRLISGILAGQDFETVLSGDASCSIKTPILRKQSIVDRQSAPDKKLLICVVPFAKDPNITAL